MSRHISSFLRSCFPHSNVPEFWVDCFMNLLKSQIHHVLKWETIILFKVLKEISEETSTFLFLFSFYWWIEKYRKCFLIEYESSSNTRQSDNLCSYCNPRLESILEILRLSSAVVSGVDGKPHVNNECQQMILEIFPSHYPAQHPQHQQQKYFTFKTTVSCHKEKKLLLWKILILS